MSVVAAATEGESSETGSCSPKVSCLQRPLDPEPQTYLTGVSGIMMEAVLPPRPVR